MNSAGGNLQFDNKLVELVSSNPVLYGKELRSCPYDTMRKKIELWKSIAVSLKTDSRYCITRWKALKDRFQRELQKTKESRQKGIAAKGSTWIMYDKLLFLTGHTNYHGTYVKGTQIHKPTFCSGMVAENPKQETCDDDPFQEAMDEQSNYERERNEIVTSAATSSTTASATSIADQSVKNLRRIEVLLEGIDDTNRVKAEKRIVTYLCKCQIKSLNNEDIDDVTI